MASETEPVDREIVITHTAKSKALRLRSERQLRNHVRNQPGTVYRKGDSELVDAAMGALEQMRRQR